MREHSNMVTDETVIKVDKVSKKFRLGSAAGRTLKSAALDWALRRKHPEDEFWALQDVSFEVKKGETLGIIGANGAGKSTLLSLITGTYKPTAGEITTNGQISALLELGAGFHPDLSGRENVFLYGATMGISRAKMKERFESIVAFAELQEWIDEPVKHYSSGMYVRLAFSVAVEVDPDILLIDEVWAVGDAGFQKKCLERMEDFRERGKTMIIISHDLPTIEGASDKIMFLDHGTVHDFGYPSDMVQEYHEFVRKKEKDQESQKKIWGTGEIVLTDVDFLDPEGRVVKTVESGPMSVRIHYDAKKKIEDPVFGFAIGDMHGRLLYGSNTQVEDFHVPTVEGSGSVILHFDDLTVSKGSYLFSFSVHSQDHLTNYYRLDNAFPLEVTCDKKYEGCFMPTRWTT